MKCTPIVALDYPNVELALAMVERLGALADFYKVGNELFTAAGPALVERLRKGGAQVFLDLKFHDIPNTVAGGVRSAIAAGANLVTVHASGGRAMLEAAVEASDSNRLCGILGVTVLTSLDEAGLGEVWGRRDLDMKAEVLRLAGVCAAARLHGVVASGLEAPAINQEFGETLATLVPGIRFAGGDTQDQARVATPRSAFEAGARYIVLGRAVTGAKDPAEAMRRVREELGGREVIRNV